MFISIRLTEEERALAENYARSHLTSLSGAFKLALFEKIEDEHDIAAGQEACNEFLAEGRKSRPVQELWNECGL